VSLKSVLLLILFVAGVVAWFRDVFHLMATWRRFAEGKGFIDAWFVAGFQAMLDKKHLLLFAQFMALLLVALLVNKYLPQ